MIIKIKMYLNNTLGNYSVIVKYIFIIHNINIIYNIRH